MTLQDFISRLEKINIPLVFGAFEKDLPSLPYMYYTTPGVSPFYADGEVYFCGKTVELTVCAPRKSLALELKIHNALRGVTYTREEARNESENRYEYTYTLEVS